MWLLVNATDVLLINNSDRYPIFLIEDARVAKAHENIMIAVYICSDFYIIEKTFTSGEKP